MPLSIQHLNADSTFLLSFFPESEPAPNGCRTESLKPFSILTDPWLAGESLIWTAKFSISKHTLDPVVNSLQDLPLPDLIIISQDKTDHCHETTLRTLPRDSPVHILAVPSAARLIKSWKHFTHATIQTLPIYNHKNPSTTLRFPVQPSNPTSGHPGEITVTYIPQRYDVTNLHNVIGITYTSPSSSTHETSTGELVELPLSPPTTPVGSSQHLPTSRPLSVLYAPHGIGISCITPYMKHHLSPISALPLTLLLHCVNVAQNPWWLGGLVAPGLPGGAALVKNFGAETWCSTHDERKECTGWATSLLRARAYGMEEAQRDLDGMVGGEGKTRLVSLDVGEHMSVGRT